MQTVQGERLSSPLEKAVLPPVKPDGTLFWWIFRDAATPLPKLATTALQVGFPTLFLPLPFPVSLQVVFRRALNRATVKLPSRIGGRWRADIPDPEEHANLSIPPELVTWSKGFKPAPILGLLEKREPRKKELWHVRLWLALRCDPEAASKPLDEILRVFEETGEGPVDITAQIKQSVTSPVTRAMAHRVYKKIEDERRHAMAPEIGEGVLEALEDVSGVRLRPGLCVMPGEEGADRVRATAAYLKKVGRQKGWTEEERAEEGRTIFGSYPLYDLPTAVTRGTSLVQAGLELQIQALQGDLDSLRPPEVGVGALRTQADLVRALERRIEANAILLGPGTTQALQKRLREAQRRLAALQNEKQRLLNRQVLLQRKPTTSEVLSLRDGLAQLHVAARKRDAEALPKVNAKLKAGQYAALAAAFAPFLRRLRKLIDATVHVHDLHGEREARPLFKALESAATFVEDRAHGMLSTLTPEPVPKPADPRSRTLKH